MSQFVSIRAESQPIGTVQILTTGSYPLGFALYCEALKRGLDAETEDCTIETTPSVRVWFAGGEQDAQDIITAAQHAPFVLAAHKHAMHESTAHDATRLRDTTEQGGGQ